jgi:phosphatidyl-myo-inositol dimannoside synthase
VRVLFLYLTAFSKTGGIESFNRAFIKALSQNASINKFRTLSCYDQIPDIRYISPSDFKGYNQDKIYFTVAALRATPQSDVIILGHINLAPVGLLIKLLFPRKKLLIIAHGIEVWNIRSYLHKRLLLQVDTILAVSNFTRDRMVDTLKLPAEKISIFHNSLDPFFNLPREFRKPEYLLERYGLDKKNRVILTVARLSSTEVFKGYDKVIAALAEIRHSNNGLRYLLCGKCDPAEKIRLRQIIQERGLEEAVIMPGYISEAELIDHYLLADLFIMPSKKEGFGIVFIEAMACGLPVIAGNQDGSVDALENGELGILVRPDDQAEITAAIEKQLHTPADKQVLQARVISRFGTKAYTQQVNSLINQVTCL